MAPVEGAGSGHSFDPAAEEDTELLMLLWLINSKLMPSFFALFIDKVSSFFHKSSRSRSRFLSLQKTKKYKTIFRENDICIVDPLCNHSLKEN